MKQISICLVGCLPLLLSAPPALAQVPAVQGYGILNAWTTIAASATSVAVVLPGSGNSVTIYNDSTADAYVMLGLTNAVVATTSSVPVPPNRAITLFVNNNNYVAAISTATSVLRVLQGNGPIPIQ